MLILCFKKSLSIYISSSYFFKLLKSFYFYSIIFFIAFSPSCIARPKFLAFDSSDISFSFVLVNYFFSVSMSWFDFSIKSLASSSLLIRVVLFLDSNYDMSFCISKFNPSKWSTCSAFSLVSLLKFIIFFCKLPISSSLVRIISLNSLRLFSKSFFYFWYEFYISCLCWLNYVTSLLKFPSIFKNLAR